MYKVFINETPLILAQDEEDLSEFADFQHEQFTKKKALLKLIMRVFNYASKGVVVTHYDLNELYYALRRITTNVPAAGGIVINEKNEVLFIERRGKWDLPKGKLEKGENPKEASVREVEEECGLVNITLGNKAMDTYHMYIQDNEVCFKKSYWYFMKASSQQDLAPQLEEEITRVVWVPQTEIEEKLENTFSSIKWLVEETILHHTYE